MGHKKEMKIQYQDLKLILKKRDNHKAHHEYKQLKNGFFCLKNLAEIKLH